MISKSIFQHIIRTLNEIPIRPIVLLAGDEQQQQPIESIEGKTTQAAGYNPGRAGSMS